MNDDLISRKALKADIGKRYDLLVQNKGGGFRELCDVYWEAINNAPPALFPLTVQIVDKVTDEDIEALKQLMKDYKPQILRLEDKRPQGELAEKLKDRIEKSVCKYCQMNKHCELCEISRVFSIIDLTDKEMRGGAE